MTVSTHRSSLSEHYVNSITTHQESLDQVHIDVGSWVVVLYDERPYVGQLEEAENDDEVTVTVMYQRGAK